MARTVRGDGHVNERIGTARGTPLVPHPRHRSNPLDAANILKPSGRGVFLINQLMDEVAYADGGREVQMRKRREGSAVPQM